MRARYDAELPPFTSIVQHPGHPVILGVGVCPSIQALLHLFREIPPGLLQHVLTVLVFWSWVLLLARLPPWSRSLGLFPGLVFCFTSPWTLLGSAARSYPTTRAKTGRTAHVFTAQGGTSTFMRGQKSHRARNPENSRQRKIRKGRTWAIAVWRGSSKSLFLLNSGRFSLEKQGNSVLNFGSRKTV